MAFSAIRDWAMNRSWQYEPTYWPSNVHIIFDTEKQILQPHPFVRPTLLDATLHIFQNVDERAVTDKNINLDTEQTEKLDGLLQMTYMYNNILECQMRYIERDGKRTWYFRPSSCRTLREWIKDLK